MPGYKTASSQASPTAEAAEYAELVQRAQQAQGPERERLFNALVDQFAIAAQSWAYAKLENIHAAQDAVQEAFLTAYKNLDDLQDAAAFPSWLRRIVWTQCNRQMRKAKHVVALDDASLPAYADLSTEVEQRMLYRRLREAVHALPAHERVVTELFYLEEYSQQEVAEQLGIPLTTVKKRLQRAREHLRETMPPLNGLTMRLLMRAA
ncbi:RNA polymerase sigma factor [Phototrophicus methaneseepsis]|uniref:RNA polymerase sigma factor n=1 Tax=Phototrophicus methaneseepsis TaxID=2710758 RepID=A0A7S8EBS6_9CHLR|nr:RNA polymerase sigma factor [Phototrophicus methaneseepsis]QPC84082.1 RNA polymerase sigma factor [Phototrophicus methaneseepsis]